MKFNTTKTTLDDIFKGRFFYNCIISNILT